MTHLNDEIWERAASPEKEWHEGERGDKRETLGRVQWYINMKHSV